MFNLRPGSREKRDYLRMNIDTEVSCRIKGANDEFTGKCKNLSHKGIQIETSKLLKAGDIIDITVQVAGGLKQQPLHAVLSVIRVEKNAGLYTISGTLDNVK
jgi:hypothetical protein